VVKQTGRAVNHSPPFSAAVKNGWSYTSDPLHVSITWTKTALPPTQNSMKFDKRFRRRPRSRRW